MFVLTGTPSCSIVALPQSPRCLKDKPTIMDVNLTVSQVSRVAVIGANGAGKSTAIKVQALAVMMMTRIRTWGSRNGGLPFAQKQLYSSQKILHTYLFIRNSFPEIVYFSYIKIFRGN